MLRKILIAISMLVSVPVSAAPVTIEMSAQTTGALLISREPFVSDFRALTGITGDVFDLVVQFDIEPATLRADSPTTVLPVQNVRFLTPALAGTSIPSGLPYNIAALSDGQFGGFPGQDAVILNAAIQTNSFGGGQFFVDFGLRLADPALVQDPFDPATIVNWSGQLGSFSGQIGPPVFAFVGNSGGFQYINQLATSATFRVVNVINVPEPAYILTFAIGLAAIGRYQRRKSVAC